MKKINFLFLIIILFPFFGFSQMAPEGCSTVYALVPVSHIHENINWDDEKDPFRNRILDQIEEKLGFEGLRESLSLIHI